jgi:hypothetical protein
MIIMAGEIEIIDAQVRARQADSTQADLTPRHGTQIVD